MLTASTQSNGCSLLAGSSSFPVAVFLSCSYIFLIPAQTQPVTAAAIKGARRHKHQHPDTPVAAGLLVENACHYPPSIEMDIVVAKKAAIHEENG